MIEHEDDCSPDTLLWVLSILSVVNGCLILFVWRFMRLVFDSVRRLERCVLDHATHGYREKFCWLNKRWESGHITDLCTTYTVAWLSTHFVCFEPFFIRASLQFFDFVGCIWPVKSLVQAIPKGSYDSSGVIFWKIGRLSKRHSFLLHAKTFLYWCTILLQYVLCCKCSQFSHISGLLL